MDWKLRKAKQNIRDRLLSKLDFKHPIKYLGLPAAEALFEKELLNAFDVESMDLFEFKKDIFNSLYDTSIELKKRTRVNLCNSDVDLFLKDHDCDHDFIWLDYCGPVTPLRLENLSNILSKMKPNSYCAVTYLVGREKGPIRLMLKDSTLHHPWDRINLILNNVPTIHFDTTVFSYRDNAPMLCFLFQKKEDGNLNNTTFTLERDLHLC